MIGTIGYIYCWLMMSINCANTSAKLDLANVKFAEQAETLLTGISVTKEPGIKKSISYKINDKTKCAFAGASMEFSMSLIAQNNIVSSVYAETEKTASTNQVLKYLISKYHQPTYKITDDGETRAYYWKTSTLFIRFMSVEVTSRVDSKQISSFINIATLTALQNGVDPTLANAYKFVQSAK